MKKIICIGATLAVLSACNTLPSRVETAASSYSAPAEKAETVEKYRPKVQEWCDNYSHDDSGSKTTCTMINDAAVFNFRLKPGWEISPDVKADVSNKFRSWACDGKGGMNRVVNYGYAIIPYIENSHELDVITLDSCSTS